MDFFSSGFVKKARLSFWVKISY